MEKKVEAAKLQKKFTTISKGKIKKTIKNTLCRPDPVFWPNVREEQLKILEESLSTYRVEIPEFKKPHWKELKAIPKDQRPKQPKIKKVEGLIFGIAECTEALKDKKCSAVIIESTINPRTLIQPLIEACISGNVPVLCMNGLRKNTSYNFGIPTSCLAIKIGFLKELKSKIEDIANMHMLPQLLENNKKDIEMAQPKLETVQDKMEIDENVDQGCSNAINNFTYLYRTSKKTRIFNPSTENYNAKKAFIGQDFIELSAKSDKIKTHTKPYKSMVLKRITNNQNRVKRK